MNKKITVKRIVAARESLRSLSRDCGYNRRERKKFHEAAMCMDAMMNDINLVSKAAAATLREQLQRLEATENSLQWFRKHLQARDELLKETVRKAIDVLDLDVDLDI